MDKSDLLNHYLEYFPNLADRIIQQCMITLHSEGYKSIDEIYSEAAKSLKTNDTLKPKKPNISERSWNPQEQEAIGYLVKKYAGEFFSEDQIKHIAIMVNKREEAQSLETIAGLRDVSFEVLTQKLREFCALPYEGFKLSDSEAVGLRVALIRRFISDQLHFIGVAKNYLTVRTMEPIITESIGERGGTGKIGGKAAGMVLAHIILNLELKEENISEKIDIPKSWYIRNDLLEEFLKMNDLTDYQTHKYKDIAKVESEYTIVRPLFKNGKFPEYAIKKFKKILEEAGNHPLIVRSSSLLEDNIGSAFSGKYESIFLPNQGDIEDRLKAMVAAIGEVYASVLAPDPIVYRRKRNLLDYHESMGILIQKVVGFRYKHYFLPCFAGVAFSRNEYRWSPRIKREDGLIRIVMGLGTHAVDRVGGDYPKMVSPVHPTISPTESIEEKKKYSQQYIDVINLKDNTFETVHLTELLGEEKFPYLHSILSLQKNGYVSDFLTNRVEGPVHQYLITFSKLLSKTDFPQLMHKMLNTLENAYGYPVDIEFASDGKKLYILQCRPLMERAEMEEGAYPKNVKKEKIFFTTNRGITNGYVNDIQYVVYVDPRQYSKLKTEDEKLDIAKVISKINQSLNDSIFILMGPGRWGSQDIQLGVKVKYSEISNTSVLIEIARETDGTTPEVSYGTHFFQDLVESKIYYLPLYPDEDEIIFNDAFISISENCITELAPEFGKYSKVVKCIDIEKSDNGNNLRIVMDGKKDSAIAYFTK
tara:strand:+ start:8101 stop:10380 length:2280 start_codon:yes stop_codon:yes gene_type:complete